jgi:hypothetical protein
MLASQEFIIYRVQQGDGLARDATQRGRWVVLMPRERCEMILLRMRPLPFRRLSSLFDAAGDGQEPLHGYEIFSSFGAHAIQPFANSLII